MNGLELAFVQLLKETGKVDVIVLLERSEGLAVWAMIVKACSKGGGGCKSRP